MGGSEVRLRLGGRKCLRSYLYCCLYWFSFEVIMWLGWEMNFLGMEDGISLVG